MLKKLKFLLTPILLGLGFAFIYLLVFSPELLREQFSPTKAPLNASHFSFANAVKAASPAVVNIYSESISNRPRSLRPQIARELGSGIIMSKKGYILTNYHVINNADQILVVLNDGRQFTDVQIIGYDKITDLALLKINADHLPEIPTDDNYVAQVGDIVLAIGNPLNIGQSITQGIISATNKSNLTQKRRLKLLQMDAAVNRGNSGGALVNTNGVLVGIPSLVFKPSAGTEAQGIFFATPYPLAKQVMESIIKDGRVIRGYTGFDADPVDSSGRLVRNNHTPVYGMRVARLDPLGPAWRAGFELGDIIIKINNEKTTSIDKMLTLISHSAPQSELNFTLVRNGEVLNIAVVVADLNDAPR